MGRTGRQTDRTGTRPRILALAVFVLLWAGGMGYRLVDLQVLRADEMRELARRQQETIIKLDARRGVLYDRNGRELAISIEVDSIHAVPAEIDDPAATAAALAPILEPDSRKQRKRRRALARELSKDKPFVWVERKVTPDVRERVEALDLKGIEFLQEHKRFYPNGTLAAHVIGWAGIDNEGLEGLELELDDRIRGRGGKVFALRDARGRKFLKVARQKTRQGNDIVLTIDETIQHITERELQRAVQESGAKAGTAIVMNPATGDILAMANAPTFNPNRPTASAVSSRRNRAVVDAYEPGSTLKVITMAAALERERVEPLEVIDCQNGSIRVSGALIRDHKPFGRLSASEILAKSSNVGAIKVGLRLSEDELYETILKFGLGSKTGVDLPGESKGLLRSPDKWSGVSQASLSFGQELSITPLQLITAISAVANGGVLQPPRIVLNEKDREGRVVSEYPLARGERVVSEETVRTLVRMMKEVVYDGTAGAAAIPGFTVAGKTGTAQKIGPGGTYSPDWFVASFVGFVPTSRPELAILVVLDEPRGSLYHGGDIAAPVFRRIATPALRYMGVSPEIPRSHDDSPRLMAASYGRKGSRPSATGNPLPSPDSLVMGSEVEMPDLRGHSLRRAVGYLTRVGLSTKVAGEKEGVIVAHEPAAGTVVQAGTEVVIRPGLLSNAPLGDGTVDGTPKRRSN